jgi:hypothetical protein
METPKMGVKESYYTYSAVKHSKWRKGDIEGKVGVSSRKEIAY